MLVALLYASAMYEYVFQPPCPYEWHGGSPLHAGSCWCGKNDSYCLCTPSLAVEGLIEHNEDKNDPDCLKCKVILIRRRDPPVDKYAIPGGFVQLGESAENAIIREMKEETNLSVVHLEQFKLFSDPMKDKRRQAATMVYRCIVSNLDELHSGDDAKAIRQIYLKDVLRLNLAFDHALVLTEYIQRYHPTLMQHIQK
jgi:8-oxo-dGTP diphosphatase